jgi:putative phosphoesterase
MRIVFFSDIHGNKYALESFLKLVKDKDKDIDKFFFLGDIFGYYYHQNEIINILKDNNINMILGNHDKYFVDLLEGKVEEEYLVKRYGNSYKNIKNKIDEKNQELLKKLQPFAEIELFNKKIGIFHGSIEDPYNGRIYGDTVIINKSIYQKFDFVILGHTHCVAEKNMGNTTILNPGSIGQPRDGKGSSFLILDLESNKHEFIFFDYDKSKLFEEIEIYDQDFVYLKEVLLR